MQFLLEPNLIFLIVVIAINSTLAFVVYKNNPRSAANLLFVFLSIFSSLWLIANYISTHPKFLESSIVWIRLTIFFAAPQATLLFLLAHTFPSEKIRFSRRVFFVLLALMGLVMIVNVSPFAFERVAIEDSSPRPIPGPGIMLFVVFGITMVGGSITLLIKKLKKATGIEKQQLRFILAGISAMMGAIIFTILIPVVFFGKNYFVQYSPVYTSFFLGVTAYAIVKHNLFNIRVIATELFSTLIALVFLIRVLSSNTVNEFLFNLLLFVILSVFGVLLVRGTIREIRELQRLSQAKSDFVSIVSHQLRTPLTTIKGFVSMMQEGKETDAERKDWLQKVYITNERLIRLVNDILNISRMEEGRIEYEFQDVDALDIIDGAVTEMKMPAQDKGVALLWTKPDEAVPRVRADALKLRQVFLNLIDNGIKYTDVNGWVSVRLFHNKDLRKIDVIVQDTGMGLEKKEVRSLFERFSRVGAGQKTNAEGMGIGLYIARHIMEAHNGKIWAESEGRGMGSKFYVELPTI